MSVTESAKKNVGWFFAGALVIIIIVAVGVLLFAYTQAPPSPGSSSPTPNASGGNVTIRVVAGELTSNLYGFGNTSSTITSPGPTFTVKVGSKVTILFTNGGSMGHNWAMVTQKADGSGQLAFPGAQIASAENPISPAGLGQCTFVASNTGNYYYICQVGAHVTLGMWGYFYVVP